MCLFGPTLGLAVLRKHRGRPRAKAQNRPRVTYLRGLRLDVGRLCRCLGTFSSLVFHYSERKLATGVNLSDLNLDLLAHSKNILDILHACAVDQRADLREVQEAIFAGARNFESLAALRIGNARAESLGLEVEPSDGVAILG